MEKSKENVLPVKKLKPINTVGTPAYRAKLKRTQRKCTIVDSYDLTELQAEESTTNPSAVVIGYEKLTMSDLGCLKSSAGWLNDRLINARQILLQKNFLTCMAYKMSLLPELFCLYSKMVHLYKF